MITFKTHIEISKNSDSESSVFNVIKNLDVGERVNLIRGMEKIYPLSVDLEPSSKYLEEFNVYTDVMELHLGQFIMLEQIITSNEKYKHKVDNDLDIAKLIIRPKEHKEFDNEDKDIEHKNLENILNSDVQDVYGCVNEYMKHREYVLFKQFSGVFYSVKDYDEEDEEEKEELVGEDLFQNQWYWYNIVRTLAQEDIRRYQDIYMLKMKVVLPEMSFLAQRNKIEQAKNRKRQMSNKL